MPSFQTADLVALAFFVLAWTGYHLAVEVSPLARHTLNGMMNGYRAAWMREMLARDLRMVDAQIMASLQNGTAFFASTSLIAVGGALTLLRSTDEVLRVVSELPFGHAAARAAWETKTIGLTIILMYAFFKFAWSYRLFNYAAILLGACPRAGPNAADTPAAARTAAMTMVAGQHFNRGQRAFFFALAWVGWFVSAPLFMGATAAVVVAMAVRQFGSSARAAAFLGRDIQPDERGGPDR